MRELEQWGGVFDRTPDRKMSQRAFGGHTYKRLVHIGDRTGLELIRTLQDKAVHSGIDVFMECTITRLLKDGDRVCGAAGYWRATGEFVVFSARALVLATGGAGKCWRITSNSWECTGDGHALAYEAGAELVDMEFVQFHPTGMVWPPGVVGLLVTEAVRGEGGILRNAAGERFMERYDPKRLELSTRDVVARAIYTEVKEQRGTPHGGVFLDVSHLGDATVRTKLPSMYDQFMELAGVDITREPMEVGPTCHYFMGGIRVLPDTGESTVEGLFAAGECSGGMNGANRLGGNSLSDLLVFGKRTGESAARYGAAAAAPRIDEAQVADAAAEMTGHLPGSGGEDPYRLHEELKTMMQADVGIFRDEAGLENAVGRIAELRERARSARAPPARPRTTRAGTSAATCTTCSSCPRRSRARRCCARRAAAPTAGSTSPSTTLLGRAQHRRARDAGRDGGRAAARRHGGVARRAGGRAQGGRAGMSARRLRLWRGDAAGGELVDYEVEAESGMVVLDAVLEIQRSQAPDLAVRWNCKAAKCGSCSAEVNGRPRLMCKTRLDHLPEDEPIRVEPLHAFPVIRDLVTDVSWNYEVNKRIAPFTPAPDAEWSIGQEDVDRMSEFRKCIECFLCQDVCHILRDRGMHSSYVGPRFLVRIASLEMHPLDTLDRLDMAVDDGGLGLCNITKCCSEVCPEGIHITDNAIIPLKERAVDKRYDPLVRVLRRLRLRT